MCNRSIDGGFLLHSVTNKYVFPSNVSTRYLTKYFGTNAAVVFDGYNESSKNKTNTECKQCVKNTSAEILFDE